MRLLLLLVVLVVVAVPGTREMGRYDSDLVLLLLFTM